MSNNTEPTTKSLRTRALEAHSIHQAATLAQARERVSAAQTKNLEWLRAQLAARFQIVGAVPAEFNGTLPRITVDGVTLGRSERDVCGVAIVRRCSACGKETESGNIPDLERLGKALDADDEPFIHKCSAKQPRDEAEAEVIAKHERDLLEALRSFMHTEGFAHVSDLK